MKVLISLRHSIDQFVEVDSNIILEQQMVKQLEQINISFEEMIHDYKLTNLILNNAGNN